MRYILTDPRPLGLQDLDAALRSVDAKYSIQCSERTAKLMHGRGLYALLDVVMVAGDECDDLVELRDVAAAVGGDAAGAVLDALDAATCLLTVEVKWQSRSTDKTLAKIDPMWEWLIANRRGLIHADGEGFYQGRDLILDVQRRPARKKQGPPCRQCGKPLRTALAKQCFKCGADWH